MGDFTVQNSLKARVSNPVTGRGPREGMIVQKQVAVLEYDLDGTNGPATAAYVTLISANDNKNGLIVMAIKAFATELVASDATDAILTVRDGASSPNTLGTLTVNNADARGDFTDISSYAEWESLVDGTDYSAQHVEAGVKVECAITTAAADAGTVTGRVLVVVEFIQIPSNRD